MQDGRIIVYRSRQLKPHRKNCPTYDLELAIIVFTFKIWRHYLFGETFDLFSDHQSLKYIFSQKYLNMTQRKWMELRKDYDFTLQYHHSNVNVVVDALSQKPQGLVGSLLIQEWQALEKFSRFKILLASTSEGRHFSFLVVQATIIEHILEAQRKDESLRKWFAKATTKDPEEWNISSPEGLRRRNRICVPDVKNDRTPRGTKMCKDLKWNFW